MITLEEMAVSLQGNGMTSYILTSNLDFKLFIVKRNCSTLNRMEIWITHKMCVIQTQRFRFCFKVLNKINAFVAPMTCWLPMCTYEVAWLETWIMQLLQGKNGIQRYAIQIPMGKWWQIVLLKTISSWQHWIDFVPTKIS